MVINPDLRCACRTDNNIAENVEPLQAKRPRKSNFTPAECAVIFEEAEENLSIPKSKFSSTLSSYRRKVLLFQGSWYRWFSDKLLCKDAAVDRSYLCRRGGGNFKFGFGNEVAHPCNGSEIC